MKAGEVYENPVTGERVVIRVGAEECGGELSVRRSADGFAASIDLPLAS